MPKVYGSYKTGADIYKDPKSKKFYILEWNPQTRETYKKFVSFKPSANNNKTIKALHFRKAKTRKLLKSRRHQRGGQNSTVESKILLHSNSSPLISNQHPSGVYNNLRLGGIPGEMQRGACKNSVLNTESYKTILAQQNLADPTKVFKDIQSIRTRYTQNFPGKRLVDVIYDLPSQGIQELGQQNTYTNPKMCWDHGIDNPESITGGATGIHVYVADTGSNGIGAWKLVGVFIK